jgi:hypothetical protein
MSKQIFKIKIELKGSKNPSIWRRIQVESDVTLGLFSDMILTAMGWENSHLHAFIGSDKTIYQALYEDDFGLENENEAEYTVAQLFQNSKTANYEYDFGDGWEHKLTLEEVSEPQKGTKYPQLLDGKGACPPEDCGGIWGYYSLLEAINDQQHEEYEDRREWLGLEEGETIDPKKYDLEEAKTFFSSEY